MNKKELSAKVAKQTGLTVTTVSQAIDVVFSTIKENLIEGESTMLQGFGTFSVSSRSERKGVNPSTKQPMIIPARKMVKFTVSKSIEIK
jgi:DNA-binding protein HU-beta